MFQELTTVTLYLRRAPIWGCFCKNVYAFGEHRFSSSFMGFFVGFYITIRPPLFFIIQSHTFAAENCAIGNIVK